MTNPLFSDQSGVASAFLLVGSAAAVAQSRVIPKSSMEPKRRGWMIETGRKEVEVGKK